MTDANGQKAVFEGTLVSPSRSAETNLILDKYLHAYSIYEIGTDEIYAFSKSKEVVDFQLTFGGEFLWKLELEKNNLRSGSDFVTLVQDGRGVNPMMKRETSTYKGRVKGNRDGSTRLSVRDNLLSGLVKDGESEFFIEPVSRYREDAPSGWHVVYNVDEVISTPEKLCGAEQLEKADDLLHTLDVRASGESCAKAKIALAADSSMVHKFGSSESVEDEILDIFNVVQSRYADPEVNITYEIRVIYIVAADDPWAYPLGSMFGQLGNFRVWANNGGFQTLDYAVASLWSAIEYGSGPVGVAHQNSVCGQFRYNVNQHYTSNQTRLIQVHTHELGHGWGAVHTQNANNTYIMSPSVGNLNNQWLQSNKELMSQFKASRPDGCLSLDCSSTDELEAEAVFQNITSCPGAEEGSIELTVQGGAEPYSYAWSNGATTKDIFDVAGGEYTVTIVDAAQDTLVMSYFLQSPPAIHIWEYVQLHCDSTNYASDISVSVSGGNANYDFLWSNGETTSSLSGVSSGVYTLTVTQIDQGCSKTDTITVPEYSPISVGFTDIVHATCGQDNGAGTAVLNGGNEDATIIWSEVWIWGETAVDLPPGTYSVYASVGNCEYTDDITIDEIPIYHGSTAEICGGESYEFEGTVLTEAGFYEEEFVTAAGCDSVVQLDLAVHPLSQTSVSESLCEGEFFELGGSIYFESGMYTATLQSVAGCDSIVELDLSVQPIYQASVSDTICEGEFLELGGAHYSEAGFYTVPLQSAAGCDSIVELDLAVADFWLDVNQNGGVLVAAQDGASYRWLDCNDAFAPVSGETSQSFTAPVSGSYAVEISLGGCTEITPCTEVTVLSTGLSTPDHPLRVYPNPSMGIFTVSVSPTDNIPYVVTDISGRTVATGILQKKQTDINLTDCAGGMYLLKTIGGTVKLVKFN